MLRLGFQDATAVRLIVLYVLCKSLHKTRLLKNDGQKPFSIWNAQLLFPALAFQEFTRVHTLLRLMSLSVKQILSSPSDQQGLRVRVRDGHGGHPQADQIYLRQPREGQRVLLHPGGAGHSAAGESLAHAHAHALASALAHALTSPGPGLHYRPNVSIQFTAERNAPLFLARHEPVTFCVSGFCFVFVRRAASILTPNESSCPSFFHITPLSFPLRSVTRKRLL